MEQFIVSARKYRPNSFETLIGQDNIAKTLKNSIIRGQLAHAYLFFGPRGVGKTSTARIFAKTINCLDPSDNMEPCGKCESCLSFAEGRSYCIHELDAASNNSVDDIRNLTDKVRIPPQIGKYSVYIIDEVHMLSQSAFNAFLKTLEEPPAHAIFILATTEKHKILPTILSRCQTYDFNRISAENMVKNLKLISTKEEINISEDALHIIAQKADGAMRDALTLFDQTVAFCGNNITYEQVIKNLNVLDYEYYFKLTDYFIKGDYANALLLFDEILLKGFNSLHFISGLSSHFRDLIVCKNKASKTLLDLAPSISARYDEYALNCSIGFLYNALSCTTECEISYKSGGNPRLLIEFTLIKLSHISSPADDSKGVEYVQEKENVRQEKTSEPEKMPEKKEDTKGTGTLEEKTVSEKNSGIPSIKKFMKKAIESTKGTEIEETATEEEITEESLKEGWCVMLKTISKPNLLAELSRYKPSYSVENNVITQYVSNLAQKKWIEAKCLFQMERTLQKALRNNKVKLCVETSPEQDNEQNQVKPYMPAEKAKVMLENSEEMRELQKDLDLEVS